MTYADAFAWSVLGVGIAWVLALLNRMTASASVRIDPHPIASSATKPERRVRDGAFAAFRARAGRQSVGHRLPQCLSSGFPHNCKYRAETALCVLTLIVFYRWLEAGS